MCVGGAVANVQMQDLRTVEGRLATYIHWPAAVAGSRMTPLALARAGFFKCARPPSFSFYPPPPPHCACEIE